jgi:hypothetical protein
MVRYETLLRGAFAGVVLPLALATFARSQTVAYEFPTGNGNQWNFSGALGMDFNVNTAVTITALGLFDSGQNGLMNDINVRLYNRDTQAVVASAAFSPSSFGYGLGASDFKNLLTPINLSAGFHGSIVAEGYGTLEMNGNSNSSSTYATALNTGGGALSFVGSSRYGAYGTFPTNLENSVDRYGAGNFRFTAVPEPMSLAVLGVGVAALRRRVRKR